MKNEEKEEFDYLKGQNEMLSKYAFPGRQFALMGNTEMEVPTQGLTKREYFAAMAMQGLLSHTSNSGLRNEEDYVRKSIALADGLLKQLEK